jgi:hypothetical protein
MGDKDWRDILATYLTVDKKFDSISEKIGDLASEIEDHEKRLIVVETRLENLPSAIGNICHRVIDDKVAAWRREHPSGSRNLLPPK